MCPINILLLFHNVRGCIALLTAKTFVELGVLWIISVMGIWLFGNRRTVSLCLGRESSLKCPLSLPEVLSYRKVCPSPGRWYAFSSPKSSPEAGCQQNVPPYPCSAHLPFCSFPCLFSCVSTSTLNREQWNAFTGNGRLMLRINHRCWNSEQKPSVISSGTVSPAFPHFPSSSPAFRSHMLHSCLVLSSL